MSGNPWSQAVLAQFVIAYTVLLVLIYRVSMRARRMGYSFAVWFIVGLATQGLFLVALAALPDRALQRRRSQLREELERDLAARGARSTPAAGGFATDRTLGDRTTSSD